MFILAFILNKKLGQEVKKSVYSRISLMSINPMRERVYFAKSVGFWTNLVNFILNLDSAFT